MTNSLGYGSDRLAAQRILKASNGADLEIHFAERDVAVSAVTVGQTVETATRPSAGDHPLMLPSPPSARRRPFDTFRTGRTWTMLASQRHD